jgi:SHS2 domain-containing protein
VTPGYEILEHTADVGIRAFGPTLESVFEQAGLALAEILGALASGRGQASAHRISASAGDREALLVDFLNELLLLHETEEVAFAGIRVTRLDGREVEAEVDVAPIAGETETTGVKAATYHRLRIRETDGGFEARVYLDV